MGRYVGARYAPLFNGQHDNTKAYEPLTVVYDQGNSYCSKKYVPVGVAITNSEYWVLVGNFNQQMADLQNSYNSLSGRADDLESRADGFDTQLEGVADDIEALQATTAGLDSRLHTAEPKIISLEGGVGNLDTRVKNMPKNISNRFMILRKSVNLQSVPAGGTKIGTSESISELPDLAEIGVVGVEIGNPNCTLTSCYLSGTSSTPTITARVHNNDTEHPANCEVTALVLYLNIIAN